MPEKVKPISITKKLIINRFYRELSRHFREPIDYQGVSIKIHIEQLCNQDIHFLADLNLATGNILGINVMRSGKGLCLLISVAQLQEVPRWLMEYNREG